MFCFEENRGDQDEPAGLILNDLNFVGTIQSTLVRSKQNLSLLLSISFDKDVDIGSMISDEEHFFIYFLAICTSLRSIC